MGKKKVFMYVKRITTGVVAFGLALVGAYMLAPNKVKTIDLGGNSSQIIIPDDDGGDKTPYLNEFIAHVKNSADVKGEDEIKPVKISFVDFNVAFGNVNKSTMKGDNNIAITGDTFFQMQTLNNIQFTADLNVNYDERSIPLGIGYIDSNLYLQIDQIKLKSEEGTDDMMETLNKLFFIGQDYEEGLHINLDIDEVVDVILGKVDFTSLLSSTGDSNTKTGFEIIEDSESNPAKVVDTIKITKTTTDEFAQETTEDIVNLQLNFDRNVETGATTLNNIDLGTIDLGNAVIQGKLTFEHNDSFKLYAFDDPHYTAGLGYRDGFREMFGYIGWAEKFLGVMKDRAFGLDLDATLKTTDNELITKIGLDLDLDLSTLIPSLQDLIVHEKLQELLDKADDENENEESITDKLLNKLAIGLDLSIEGNQGVENANMGIHYANQAGYITLNEDKLGGTDKAVMRAKVSTQAVKDIIAKLPESVEAEVDSNLQEVTEESLSNEETEQAESFFSAITDSTLVTAIKEGKYAPIIDLIDKANTYNDADKVVVTLNLSTLGFGANSRVIVTLDAGEAKHILNVECRDITFKKLVLDLTLNTRYFDGSNIAHVVANDSKYDELNYLPSVFDQVQGILDAKKTGFTLGGSVLNNEDHTGLVIDGWGQFDYGTKYGYGLLNLFSYDTAYSQNATPSYNHRIKLDVNNQNKNLAENNAMFAYGPNDGIKGYLTVQTVSDLMKVFSTFLKDNIDNPRYTKFITPLLDTLGLSYIAEIIDETGESYLDYTKFLSNEVIEEIKESNDGTYIKIVVNGEIMSLEDGHDLEIRINFKGQGENREILGLSVKDLVVKGKTININLDLTEYDDEVLSPLKDMHITDANVLNLSQINTLIDLGLNTTNQGYYHLTANISLALGSYEALKFNLDFHVDVDGDKTRVYGLIPKLPTIPVLGYLVVNENGQDTQTEFVFEPYTSGNDKVGGYFHILRSYIKEKSLFNWTRKQYFSYYKSTSKNFLDLDNNANNLMIYLLEDMLNVKKTWSQMAIDALNEDNNSGNKQVAYEDMFKDGGFSYSDQKMNNGRINYTWDIGINLGKLLDTSALKVLNMKLYGTRANEDAVGYLSGADVELGIINVLNLTASISLTNPGDTLEDWASSIENKYNTVINFDQRSGYTDNKYLNKPRTSFEVVVNL